MRVLKNLLRQKSSSAFTLVEVMIVMSVLSVASLYMAESLYQNSKVGKRIALKSDWDNLLTVLRILYSDDTTCTATFGKVGRAAVSLPSLTFGGSSLSINKLEQIMNTGVGTYSNNGTLLEVGTAKNGVQANSIDIIKIYDKGNVIRKVSGVDVSRKGYDVRIQIKAARVVGGGGSSTPTLVSDLVAGQTDMDPTMIRLSIYTDPSTNEIMECGGSASNAVCPDIDNEIDTQPNANAVYGHSSHNHRTCQIRNLYLNPMNAQTSTQIVMGDPYPVTSGSALPSPTNSNVGKITFDSVARTLTLVGPNIALSPIPNSSPNIYLNAGVGLTGGGVEMYGTDRVGSVFPLEVITSLTGMTYGTNTYGRNIRFADVVNGFYDIGIASATLGSALYITRRSSDPSTSPALAIYGTTGRVLVNSITDINTYVPTPTPTPSPSNPFELQVLGDVYTTGVFQVGPFPEVSGSPRSQVLINGATFPMNTNTPYPNVSPTVFPASPGPYLRLQSGTTGSYGQLTHSGNLYLDNFSTATGTKVTYINAYGGTGVTLGSVQKPQDLRVLGTLIITPPSSGVKPTCTSAIRGQIYSEIVSGKDDRLQMCIRNADGNFQWKGMISAYERACCSAPEYQNCVLTCPVGMKIKELAIGYGHSVCHNAPTCNVPFVTTTDVSDTSCGHTDSQHSQRIVASGGTPYFSRCPNQNPNAGNCIGSNSCTYYFGNGSNYCNLDTCWGHVKVGVIVAVCEY